MSNPKKDTKTISDLKKVTGGAGPATVQPSGPGSTNPPSINIERNVQHVTNLGVEMSNVAAGATGSPSTKSDGPQLPQAPQKPQKSIGAVGLDMSELGNAAAGATAVTFGSVGGSEPQIPEVFPPPAARRIQGQSPSMQELNNVTAGATAPGANYSSSGPALPNKPQFSIGQGATPVAAADLGNVAAGATAPGANVADSGPALPSKPNLKLGASNVPVQTNNNDVI